MIDGVRKFRREVLELKAKELPGFPDPEEAKYWIRNLSESFIGVFGACLRHNQTDFEFMRIRVLMEEALDRCQLDSDSHLPEAVRGLLELSYLSFLMLDRFGVPVEAAWVQLQKAAEANRRIAGVGSARGKLIRTDTYDMPEIEQLLTGETK